MYYIYPDEYRIEDYIDDYLIDLIVVYVEAESMQIVGEKGLLDAGLYSDGMSTYWVIK